MTGEPKYDDQVFRAEIKEYTSLSVSLNILWPVKYLLGLV